jgi:nitroreductase
MSTPFDLKITDELLSTTRAVRKRLDLDRPVERDVLLDCIRLAVQAPTGSNQQGWRFVIVTDADKRKALADMYRTTGEAYLRAAADSLPGGDNPQTKRVYESALYLVDVLERVPVHVIPCIAGRLPEGTPSAMQAGFFGSIFPAVWSFQLALRSRGLGSVLTTLHLAREADAAKLLGIPDDVTQVALLPVAYTKGTDFKPATRGPVEKITYFNSWAG